MEQHKEQIIKNDRMIIAQDGVRLHGWYLHSGTPVRANIVLTHGFKDYSERYLDFAKKLTKEGFDVYGMDLRGHARSEGDRVWFDDIPQVMSDFKLAIDDFKKNDNRKPWFLLGHSAGAALVSRFMADYPDVFNGFILSAPVLKRAPDLSPFVEKSLHFIDRIAPRLKVLDLKTKNYSRVPEVIDRMYTDPLIHNIKVPAHTALVMLDNMDYMENARRNITKPFLVLHSESDMINNIEGSRDFYAGTPNIPGKEIKIFSNLYHDLLHEPEHPEVEDTILGWLNKQLKPSYS